MTTRVLLLLSLNVCSASTGAMAQTAALRVKGGSGDRVISGVFRDTPVFPVDVFEHLGGAVRSDPHTLGLTLFGDTLRFWEASPFFRAGATLQQLAHETVVVDGTLRIPEQFFIQWLPSRYPSRVAYADGALQLTTQIAAASAAPASTAAVPTAAATATRREARKEPATPRRIVVIDPGHGGVDPGSTGPNHLEEKTAVLQISKRLASQLSKRGYEVHMTRTTDTLIALADRPRMANNWKGNEPGALYISIHANSGVSSARGFETYFLSDASTEDERRVAAMENAAVKYEARTHSADGELDQVLNGLRNDFYLRSSNDFAAVVQNKIAGFHPGRDRGVKRARFVVLIGALMPAVLVEVAFISNPAGARLLREDSFQDKLANSLADAVDQFFHDNEPLWVRE
jgi:N-acetylmuramoyl-L-alanine amidase